MNESESAASFQVTYSGVVQARLKEFMAEATSHGRIQDYRSALQQIDRLLHAAPLDFGEPIKNLPTKKGQVRIGFVTPMSVRFVVLPEEKQVFVVWASVTFHSIN